MTTEPGTARERLLAAAVDHVAEHGAADLSLRGLAAAIGTSHRMLLYHFGSKEGLLAEVVRTIEERTRAALEDLDATGETMATLSRLLWERLADPGMAATERLFFEMYGQALQGRPGTATLLDAAIEPWLVQGEALARRHGLAPAAARAHARLALAAGRGLLLDLLTTGDREGSREALEYFIGLWERQADQPEAGGDAGTS